MQEFILRASQVTQDRVASCRQASMALLNSPITGGAGSRDVSLLPFETPLVGFLPQVVLYFHCWVAVIFAPMKCPRLAWAYSWGSP